MQKLAIIALKYLEPEYKQTVECLEKSGFPVFYADRDGVGNMSRAFNDCFLKNIDGKFENVWFVTNILFDHQVTHKLLTALQSGYDAVHPAHESDHKHLWSDGSQIPRHINFIEFTAPMFKSEVFKKFMLDENTWYYYMDLIISYQLRQNNYKMAVHNGASISHKYLRNNTKKHPITLLREKLRNLVDKEQQQYLIQKYGANWRQIIWPS